MCTTTLGLVFVRQLPFLSLSFKSAAEYMSTSQPGVGGRARDCGDLVGKIPCIIIY
jgi:hypothetical protein